MENKFYRKSLPSIERIKELFLYDKEDGRFYNKHRRVGTEADTLSPDGYLNLFIDGKIYRAHRIVWKLVHGTEPLILDHINRIRSDNRIKNLREVNSSFNVKNTYLERYSNQEGFKGINKWGNRFRARISVGDERIHLGMFPSKEEAHQAYLLAEQKYYGRH